MEKKQARILLFGGMGLLLAAALGYALITGGGRGQQPGGLASDGSSGIVALPSGGAQTQIALSRSGSVISGSGASAEGDRVVIRQGGEYLITGTLQGQLSVEAGGDDTVILRLAGAEVTNDTDAAIQVENAGSTILWLEEGTENRLQSGTAPAEGVLSAAADDAASGGTVYARDDLTVAGEGSLQVLGYLNNGIQSSKRLTISGGKIAVEAANNGVKGKDGVTVTGGSLDILAGGDGVKSDDTTGEGYGTVAISGGEFHIQTAGDAVQAETTLEITGGSFTIQTGEGSGKADFSSSDGWGMPDAGWDLEAEGQTSAKGLKSGTLTTITGGVFAVDCQDDAFHSNGDITITGGEITAASGDDGIHADGTLTIEDGIITVTNSYEGLEGNLVYLRGGILDITASDDGVNAYGGQNRMGGWGGSGKTTDTMPELVISGGTLTVNAGGDGLDSNGSITVEGGVTIVNGPTNSGNGALDYGTENGGTCVVNGGTILALGSSGMAETFGEGSGQCSFRYGLEGSYSAGDEIVILDANGGELFRHTAVKSGSSVVFSAPGLVQGGTYTLRAGEQSAEITLSGVSTTAGTSGGGFGGRGFGGGRPGGRDFNGQPPEGMPQPPDGQQPPDGMPEMPERRGGRQGTAPQEGTAQGNTAQGNSVS